MDVVKAARAQNAFLKELGLELLPLVDSDSKKSR